MGGNALLVLEENNQSSSSWWEDIINSHNRSLQPRYAEENLWKHNTSNLEANGLKQETTPGGTPVS